jgi:hypothetical protein
MAAAAGDDAAPAAACARPAAALPAPWRELAESYGVIPAPAPRNDADAAAAAAAAEARLLWPSNVVALDAVAFACGRVARGGGLDGHAHDARELARCRALAARAQTLLAGTVVGRGDEGDHPWLAFCAPALLDGAAAPLAAAAAAAAGAGAIAAAADAGEGAAPPLVLVSEAELRRACGGALAPRLHFTSSALPQEAARYARELAEADHGGGAGGLANAAAAFSSLARFLAGELDGAEEGGEGEGEDEDEAAGLQRGSATYLRPIDRHGCGAVFPHFAVARTGAGSLVGVVGATVYT